MPRDEALALLEKAGLKPPLTLTAAVHPILKDRHKALTAALFAIWKELGVEVQITTTDMKSYLEAQTAASIDLLISRWMADYEDPDDFTFNLFRSGVGYFQAFFSSEEADRLAEEARIEGRPAVREGLYRKFETLLLDAPVFIPLFHEVDYRIAGPGVRGVALRSSPPFVNYPEIGKSEAPAAHVAHDWGGGILRVPVGGVVPDFDPASDGDLRAGRDDASRLRDADAGCRGRARRAVARPRGAPRGRRRRLPLPPAGGACVSTTAARSPPGT